MRYDEARLESHAAWLHLIINVILPSTFLTYSRLNQEDSLPLQGQPSADLDSGSPGFFGAYGQHLPKVFLPAEGGGVGRCGDVCSGNLSTSAVDTGGTLYLEVT